MTRPRFDLTGVDAAAACAAALLDEIAVDGTRDPEADWHAAYVAAWLRWLMWDYSADSTVIELAVELGLTPWQAFKRGGRIRSQADVRAIAASQPPMTPDERAQVDEWTRSTAALTPAELVERMGGRIKLGTARDIIRLCRRVVVRQASEQGRAA